MLYTLTLNPAVDYYMSLETVKLGELNRSVSESFAAGGKGINVSRMLKRLGCDSTAIIAAGGFTGNEIINSVGDEGIGVVPIGVEGNTRINVKLFGTQTELNGAGSTASRQTLDCLYDTLHGLSGDDTLIISGSACGGFDASIYADIIGRVSARCVVDADGELLRAAVKAKPYLVKPNHLELGRLFNAEVKTVADAKKYTERLLEAGVKNALVSMGAMGALFMNDEAGLFCKAAAVNAVNTVAAGDSMLAAFIYALGSGRGYDYSLQFSVACAATRIKYDDFPNLLQIMAEFSKLHIEKI